MTVSASFLERLVDLQSKGIIRRVRTPEGVAKYNQPIGSIIKPSIDLPRKKKTRKLPSMNSARKASKEPTHKTRDHSWVKGTKLRNKTARINSLDDLDWQTDPNDSEYRYARLGPIVMEQRSYKSSLSHDDVQHTRSFLGKKLHSEAYAYATAGKNTIEDFKPDTDRRFVGVLNRYRQRPEARRTQRDSPSMFDYWAGTYGWDWQYEDDDITEADFDDPVKRMKIAVQDSKDLGINVDGVVDSRGNLQFFDIGIHETINSIARAHEEMYPGFTKIQSDYALSYRNPGAYAWNQYRHLSTASGETMIRFNPNYWAESKDDKNVERFTDDKRVATKTGWASTEDTDRLAEELDMEKWQVAAAHTITHEIGHTVARAIFGELQREGIDREAWREEYALNVAPILEKYGIVLDEERLDVVDTTSIWATSGIDPFKKNSQKKLPSGFDKMMLTAHLSEYGATNLHEMMAETWASFLIDPNPTEFVQELGEAMENMLMVWLEEAGLSE